MPEQHLSDVIRYIRRIASTEDEVRTDRELLADFAARNDQAAFTAMVKRHGPMVMGICRRILHHLQDAVEDTLESAVRRDAVGQFQEALQPVVMFASESFNIGLSVGTGEDGADGDGVDIAQQVPLATIEAGVFEAANVLVQGQTRPNHDSPP